MPIPLYLLPIIGAALGAATNLNDPKQALKNAAIGGLVGSGAYLGGGLLAPASGTVGGTLGSGMAPSYGLLGGANVVGNPALMSYPITAASSSMPLGQKIMLGLMGAGLARDMLTPSGATPPPLSLEGQVTPIGGISNPLPSQQSKINLFELLRLLQGG